MSGLPSPPVIYSSIDEALQDTAVECFLSGIYTAVLLVTLSGFYRGRKQHSNNFWMITVTLVMYTLSMIHMAYHWWLSRHAFVNNNQSPQEIFIAFYKLPFWGRLLGSIVFALNTLVADCLFIWRCWIIWNCDWRVIVLPILTTLVGTVFSGLNLAIQVANSEFKLTGRFIDTGTPYLALSLATTLYVTVMITYRIWKIALSGMSDKRSRDVYSKVIEAVVESAVLYSIALLIMVVLIIRQNTLYRYMQDIVAQIVGLAPTLILARISLGFSNPGEYATRQRRSDTDTEMVFAPSVFQSSANNSGSSPTLQGGGLGDTNSKTTPSAQFSRSLSNGFSGGDEH